MSRLHRLLAEATAEYRSFVRHRTALFFTFVFPVLIVTAFAAAIRAGDGEFLGAEASFFLPGFLALVLVFTPLSRIDGSVQRDLAAGRLEKLATTPLSPAEWLLARTVVAAALAAIPGIVLLVIAVVATDASASPSPWLLVLSVAVLATFAGAGAIIGRIADSEDGAIAIGNAVGFPIVFFSETLVPPATVPEVLHPLLALSPVTHFARAARTAFAGGTPAALELGIVILVAIGTFAIGVWVLPTVRR